MADQGGFFPLPAGPFRPSRGSMTPPRQPRVALFDMDGLLFDAEAALILRPGEEARRGAAGLYASLVQALDRRQEWF